MSFAALKPASFPWYDYSRYSFSLGLKSASGTYLSGHTGSQYDAATKRIVVRGGMTDQVRTAWAKIGAILESGGLSYGDVVRVVEYVKPEGIERYAEADALRREIFRGHRPVVHTVPVKALLRPEAFIEIEVTASAAPGAKLSSGVVFLPTVQPVDDQGNIVGAGDDTVHPWSDAASLAAAGAGPVERHEPGSTEPHRAGCRTREPDRFL